MGKFEFNGKSTEEFGLVIQTPPDYTYPQRDVSTVHVPGRTGDLHLDNGSFKNVTRTYSLAKAFRRNNKNMYINFEQVLAWLHSAKGDYVRLADDYDKNVFRKASFYSNGSVTNLYDEAMAFTVTFDCKPQRYLLDGEKVVNLTLVNSNSGKITQIENTYHFDSLPSITINNIDDPLSDLDKVVMITISDKNDITSSITINKLGYGNTALGSITIDSENQSVKDSNGKNVNNVLALNGKDFPVLKDGINNIEISKYSVDTYSPTAIQQDHQIPTFNHLIAEAQSIIKAEYRPKKQLIELEQDKYIIKSWEKLIESKQIRYPASSLQAHVEEASDKYTFGSIQDLLDAYTEAYTFVGEWDSIPGDESSVTISGVTYTNVKRPTDWLYLVLIDNNIKMFTATNSFFILKDKDKKIMYKGAGAELGIASSNKNNVVYCYPTEIVSINGSQVPRLKIAFEGVPSWVTYTITYEDGGAYSPIKVEYKVNAAGYLWQDKVGLFGKAGWKKYNADDVGTVLNKLDWNGSKLAFTKSEGLSSSTNTQLTYMYISDIPQYEDLQANATDEDGDTYTKVTAECTFTVKSNNNLSTVYIYANRNGYYRVNYGNTNQSWVSVYKHAGDQIAAINSGTTAFDVYYLSAIPSYSDEENWPIWLDPNPIRTGENPLEPISIGYKVLATSNYRHTSVTDPETLPDTWESLNEDDVITFTNASGIEAYKVSYTICKLDQIPTERPFDRVYLDGGDNEYLLSDIPWLDVKYYKDKLMEEEVQTDVDYRALPESTRSKLYVRFMAKHVGYFKWDNNEAWLYKTLSEPDLLLTGIKDATIFYYFETLPSYADYPLFEVHAESDASGNPEVVVFTIKVDGYYRANNNSDWTYYKEGDTIIKSKVGESNTIRYLSPVSDNTLDGVTITIIPRWWML